MKPLNFGRLSRDGNIDIEAGALDNAPDWVDAHVVRGVLGDSAVVYHGTDVVVTNVVDGFMPNRANVTIRVGADVQVWSLRRVEDPPGTVSFHICDAAGNNQCRHGSVS